MFVENYHLGGRGGEAPVLKIDNNRRSSVSNDTDSLNIYERHFEYLVIMTKKGNSLAKTSKIKTYPEFFSAKSSPNSKLYHECLLCEMGT